MKNALKTIIPAVALFFVTNYSSAQNNDSQQTKLDSIITEILNDGYKRPSCEEETCKDTFFKKNSNGRYTALIRIPNTNFYRESPGPSVKKAINLAENKTFELEIDLKRNMNEKQFIESLNIIDTNHDYRINYAEMKVFWQ